MSNNSWKTNFYLYSTTHCFAVNISPQAYNFLPFIFSSLIKQYYVKVMTVEDDHGQRLQTYKKNINFVNQKHYREKE